MNFTCLSDRGFKYDHEVGTAGHRTDALNGLEIKLKTAIVDLKNAIAGRAVVSAAAGVIGVSKVASGIAAFEAAAAAQKAAKTADAGVVELRAIVKNLQEWLRRQNCVVRPDGSINAALSAQVVVYDQTAAQQNMTRVYVHGGRLYLDAARTRLLDTAGMVTHFAGPGHAIFVLSATGNLHVSNHSVGHRHHSSLLAGGRVACAGELRVKAGVLTYMSNKSGHYAPSVVHVLQMLHLLQKNGVPMTFALELVPDNVTYRSVGAYLSYLQVEEVPDYELQKLFAYWPHLTDAVFVTHTPDPWRWRDLPRFPNELVGVYTVATNAPVPHKTVRAWLKSRGLMPRQEINYGHTR